MRVKVYDYGIISVAVSRPFAGSWAELMRAGEQMSELEGRATALSASVTARLRALVSARLGLDRWKANVEDKLQTLDDIYRFAVEQTQMSRANLLELTIVFILVLELALVFIC